MEEMSLILALNIDKNRNLKNGCNWDEVDHARTRKYRTCLGEGQRFSHMKYMKMACGEISVSTVLELEPWGLNSSSTVH